MQMFMLDSSPLAATVGGGFLSGVLLGYAMKKVIKLIAIIFGLFIAGLTFLQYQQIASVNWDKIEGSITGFISTTANILNETSLTTLAISNFDIP